MQNVPLQIANRVVGLAEQVVDADLVEICQLNQQFSRKRLNACFHIAVLPLCNADLLGKLLLRQVVILPQIPDDFQIDL